MEIYLDEKSPLPKYQQITEQLYAMIRSGELKTGEKLPPERELGKENHIARGTVQMAYQELVSKQDFPVSNLAANQLCLILDKVLHIPIGGSFTCVKHKLL